MAERRVHRIVQGSSRNQWDDRRHQNRRRRCLQNSRPDLRVDRDQNRNHEKSQIFIIHKMQKRQINCPEDSAADRRDPAPLPPSSGPSPVRLFSGLSAPFSPFPFKCFPGIMFPFPDFLLYGAGIFFLQVASACSIRALSAFVCSGGCDRAYDRLSHDVPVLINDIGRWECIQSCGKTAGIAVGVKPEILIGCSLF